MGWEFRETEDVEHIFSIFFLRRTPQICQPKVEGALSMGGSWLEIHVTHHPGHAITFVSCDYPELRFGLHADSVVLVYFLHVLGSIEGGFISSPNGFKQTLGLCFRNYGLR